MEPLDKVREIRAANNNSWMRLVEIALQHAPEETKAVLADIVRRDKEVSAAMEELIFNSRPRRTDREMEELING